MNFTRTLILTILTGLLITCGNSTKKSNVDKIIQEKSDTVNIEHSEVIEEFQNSGYLKIVGDLVEIPYFEIELKLSEKAEEKLKTDNETVMLIT